MSSGMAIITGGGTGIGRSLALILAHRGLPVLITGRRTAPLEAVVQEGPAGRIGHVRADVSTPEGRAAIAEAAPGEVRFLVHCAAVLEPIQPLGQVTLEAWREAQAINVEGPLFLTQQLMGRFARGTRILNISSGAAHHAYAGWGSYCVSKAALHMLYLVFREELKGSGITIGSARPGVVDTPMQELIRNTSPERFPHVERFRKLKQNGLLVDPRDAGRFLAWLLLETSDREFGEQEWDIADTESRWRAFQA